MDGEKVYNGKRGQGLGTGTVHRAQRKINTIQKIEIAENDPKSFFITWNEEKELYVIEYNCENTQDCADIVAKIKFILANPKPEHGRH